MVRLGTGLLAGWLIAVCVAGAAFAQGAERRIVPAPGSDYYGHDYDILKDATQDLCETACLSDNQCRAFTFNTAKGWCFLKSEAGELRAAAGTVSGRIAEGAAPAADEATLRERESALSFLDRETLEAARSLRLGLAEEEADAAAPRGEALWPAADAALAARDYAGAARLYREALRRDPSSGRAWLGLALASLEDADSATVSASTETRLPAAINAFIAGADERERSAALDFLGRSLAAQDSWREAIRAYRLSVATLARPETQGRLDAAVAEHGFRILGNSVDNNASSPRICLNFSEPLAPGVTAGEAAGDYLQVEGGDTLPVSASGSQICVDGVRHGQRYRIVARRGIPAASGETLAKSAESSIYVRDRDPSVRLSGNAYVLPAGGEATIPVTTVNTDTVEARLLRIGDRALAGAVGGSRFLQQLESYDVDQIVANDGEEVWKGAVDVSREANEEVVTAIPVAAILKEQKAGVYILSARAKNARAEDTTPATQWFVLTDIGLASFSGADGFHVFARSLGTAEPLGGVRLQLVAANNEILGSVETDATGHARLAPGLLRGTGGQRPALVTATSGDGGDFAFLDMTGAPFDLADRGVGGRAAPGALDVFLTPERGIYRAGDTVHLTALLREAGGRAALGVGPVTAILKRPDGVEDRRTVLQAREAGGLVWDVGLSGSAMRGIWTAQLLLDPKQPAIGSATFRVEDFEPERIRVSLSVPEGAIDPASPPALGVEVRTLFGSAGAGLAVSGETILSATDRIERYPGVRFGLASDQPTATRLPFEGEPTDEEGRGTVRLAPFDLPGTTKPLVASIQLRVADVGGRPVEEIAARPLRATSGRLGIRPGFEGTLGENAEAGFDLVALDAAGERTALAGARWVLDRIQTDYQWYSANGRWNYEAVQRRERVADGRVDIAAGEPGRVSRPVRWGSYELTLTDPAGAALPASLAFEAGWSTAPRTAETPDVLALTLDKPRYGVGETARVHVEPRFAGRAQVLVLSDRLVSVQEVPVALGGTDVELPVTADWGPSAYVTAVVYRPMDIEARQMPSRAIGLAHAAGDPGDAKLALSVDTPEQARPREPLEVAVRLANARPGVPAFVTLAAVDVGILNVTDFQPPAPSEFLFGQRRLGVEIRDLYSRLIDRMQGAPGAVRSGGDAGAFGERPPPMDQLVALFSGIVAVDADGVARVRFDVPDFNGTLRLMAIGWSEGGVGEASRDVVVRDPVVAQVSRPSFLSPGDRSRIAVDLDHVDGPAGEIALTLAGTDGSLRLGEGASATLDLADHGHARLSVPVEAVSAGAGELELAMTTPGGEQLVKRFALPVRSIQPRDLRKSRFEIAGGGGQLALDPALLADFQPGTGRLTLSVTSLGGFDVAGVVASLDRYPYGCTEQLTSRALPLLYLDETVLAAGLPGAGAEDLRARVTGAIGAVLANQDSSGAFGLWAPGGGDLWLDAYVTDFLSRARERGYDVPAEGLTLALDNLANQVAYLGDTPDWDRASYAYYVLARNGRAAIGDLRYTADNEAARFRSPLAQAQLAAALGFYGDRLRAEALMRQAAEAAGRGASDAPSRSDYGSPLRDGAGVLTLALETGQEGVDLRALVRRVGEERAARRHTSTQEDVWSLLAAHAALERRPPSLAIDGVERSGDWSASLDPAALATGAPRIENRGAEPVSASVTVSGVPRLAPPAEASGYEITRQYYTMEGEEADPSAIAQGDRLVAVVEVLPVDRAAARLMIDDPLPAGFSIDNPAILKGGDLAALDFLDLSEDAAHTEFRSDRFLAAVDKTEGETGAFRFAYVVRALSPGEFVHPAAVVEDMYRPERRGRTDEGRVSVVGPVR
ncbi:alpha-2-macroglobulin family protein [Aureimonas sp. AU4]|uniref:alpha-2-macroglobulin family protein n=1 Tax=Aureimonas sp. AU4 TaxID=1638163 RepID=UPI0007851CE5|nr:alpha-2-macroglobulin family protein [Aureimonas sp. AU4]